MNRRKFLGLLAAAPAVAAMPVLAAPVAEVLKGPASMLVKVTWRQEYFDYGYQLGVAGHFTLPNGTELANTVLNFVDAQREQDIESHAKYLLHQWLEQKLGCDVYLEQGSLILPPTRRGQWHAG